MRVSLFIPCFVDTLFPGTGRAMVRILEEAGQRAGIPLILDFPADQTCCGQIQHNSGLAAEARRLASHCVEVFRDSEIVVAPSASCVAMIRDQYAGLLPPGGGEHSPLSERVQELTQFLVHTLGVTDLGARFPFPVAFHPTCHSTRFLGLTDEPHRLLGQVADLRRVEHPDADTCCGFGGTFAVKNPETSVAIMEDKLEALVSSGARVVTAVDDSCLMHLAGGIRRRGLPLVPLHLARILDPAGEAAAELAAAPMAAGHGDLELP